MNMKYALRSEDTEQINVISWASWQMQKYPELKWLHHIPNGGSRNRAEAIKLKQMGVKSGVSDLCLPYPKGIYCGLYIEMKYDKGRHQPSQKDKTVSDLLEEEDKLKKILQRMKENGQTIMGIDLNSGRIRDVVAYFLKIAPTKVAQIENINKHLIPEFSKELKEGRLTFSAAYMISGMNEETQAEMLERYQENGLTYKEVKEIKQQQEEKAAAEQIEGQMNIDQFTEAEEEIEEPEDDAEDTEEEDEWEDAHPESITSLCYSCKRYSDCNVKTGTCQSCDQYINKAEAEKTEEERYSEEQDAIDRETAKKLREKADEEKMQQLPSQQEKKVHDVKLGTTFFDDVKTGRKTFELRKNDRGYKEGDIIVMHEYKDGTTTGRTIEKKIVYMLEDFTGLEDGYCILGLGEVKAGEE